MASLLLYVRCDEASYFFEPRTTSTLGMLSSTFGENCRYPPKYRTRVLTTNTRHPKPGGRMMIHLNNLS